MAKVTNVDTRWEASQDAYTLIEATKIQSDKARLNRAKPQIKRIVKEKELDAKAAKKAANKIKKPVTKKRVSKTKTKK